MATDLFLFWFHHVAAGVSAKHIKEGRLFEKFYIMGEVYMVLDLHSMTYSERKAYYASIGKVLVRSHFRIRSSTGIRDVFVPEHVRDKPRSRKYK